MPQCRQRGRPPVRRRRRPPGPVRPPRAPPAPPAHPPGHPRPPPATTTPTQTPGTTLTMSYLKRNKSRSSVLIEIVEVRVMIAR